MNLGEQQPLRIAYLGPEGTYSEEAARKQYGAASTYLPVDSFDEALHAVEAGAADIAVVPFHNSTVGMVEHTTNILRQSPLAVRGELLLPIHHQLLTNAKSLSDVKEVVGHPQALAQCRRWLDEHVPSVKRIAANSTAEAAIKAGQDSSLAAIAGECASTIYEVPILVANIEDDPSNATRFLMLGKQPSGSVALGRAGLN